MFDTFSILLVLAIALSAVALRYRNLLFTFGAILGWIVLWVFNQNNPPTNITQGSFGHEILYYIFIIMAIGVFFIYMRNRSRGYTGYPMTRGEESELEQRRLSNRPARGLMDLDNNEYRAVIRARMRSRRRR